MTSIKNSTNYSASSPTIPPPPPSPGRQRTISDLNLRSPKIQSSPILLHPLPPTSSLNKESVYASELELDKQIRQVKKERQLQEALQEQLFSAERLKVKEEQGTWSSIQQNNLKGRTDGRGRGDSWGHSKGFAHPPQAYELYKAIDDHNIDFIMRIRDHDFNLLLQKNGNEFPILYATRLGERWRDVVILLVGALSRYVNHLNAEDFEKKETLRMLKALRANLKLAIDHTLLHLPAGHSPMLLSSYLQVLIMSEGDSFLYKSIHEISLLLRSSTSASAVAGENVKPVKEAGNIIRKFCTKELRGVKGGIGDVEEYIANATLDLVIMSAWSLVNSGELLPTHTFARDLRTYSTFMEYLQDDPNLSSINKLNPRIRKTLYTLRDLAGDSKKSVRGRLRDVQIALDGE
ncbi:hypothetical protein L486_04446 [Kwoniella mangroviensis CBS 10435]|uniref:Uncharacterized protein n=1 Tax=Kwoniella mangroviensis CBS 10435 TaxID=1331196 RepID=A0A1B9ISA0_9TREE|nr:uncharacterized protein I203_06650 [Kwoniella mangroviensis CBS 8507]OCF58413.1 hypothetical protein L486_04446 [Kwoniella mangroviensis CBS 10435]OCF64066.1 hypothetical protein I203_06650 [Kwoniella mangroviensis CBS 8507]